MTIQQFFSPTVSDWVKEINEKHPHLSHEEFTKLFEEWFEKNEESIVLNESIDMSKYCRLNEDTDDFDLDDFKFEDEDEPEAAPIEPESEPEDKTIKTSTPRKTVIDDDDDFKFEEDDDDESGETFKDIEGGDAEIVDKPVIIKPLSDGDVEEIASKIKGKYLVNNGDDYIHNIFNVVNAWYDDSIKKGDGENLKENSRISLLDTSLVEDMRALFAFANVPNLNLSGWDVSAVRNMEGMFYKSTFDSKSIEDWDVSMCINFKNMFEHCRFSGDISGWTPGKVLKTVFDDYGKPKMHIKKDHTGKELRDPEKDEPIWEYDKVRVDADLPEVGNRTHGVNDAKNRRILKALRGLDDEERDRLADEKESRLLSHADESYSMKNIVDFETFMNEGFIDKIKGGINKVKNAIKAFTTKINNYYVALFKEDGTLYDAVNKFTTLNYIATGKVAGVKAYSGSNSSLLNDNVKSKATIEDDGEYYGIVRSGVEYDNFLTLLDALGGKGEVSESLVMEDRMPLGSANSGVDGVPDIGSDMLKDLMREMIDEAPAYKMDDEESKTLLIFGAPGIGKSTIPKAIIDEYNAANPKKKKALLTIECGDLTLDGFYLPIPEFTSLGAQVEANPEAVAKLGLSAETIENFRSKKIRRVVEAPKTWLPVYTPSTDRNENLALNAIANGRRLEEMVWDAELGEKVPVVEETTEGGIIMFDEFLRADPEIFKILMQIILNRRTADGKRFGSKWSFICCSNRPVDDEEVANRYAGLSAAAATRFLKGVYNFIPDFYDWKKWAETKGHFDEYTLEFISRSTDGNKDEYKVSSYSGEKTVTTFKNWHNIDLDDKRNFITPMPRTWAALMDDINSEIRRRKVESIVDLPNTWIRTKAIGIIGKETGEKYANFLESVAKKGGPRMKDLFTKEGYSIDTEEFGLPEVSKRVTDYLMTNYFRKDGEVKLPSDKEMFVMTKNMHLNYGKNSGSFLVGMHSNIVRDIFKIRSTDSAIIKKLRQYLKLIAKIYGVEFADDKPITVE